MKALTRLIQTTRRFSASSVCRHTEGVWQQKGVPGKVRCMILHDIELLIIIMSTTSLLTERRGKVNDYVCDVLVTWHRRRNVLFMKIMLAAIKTSLIKS